MWLLWAPPGDHFHCWFQPAYLSRVKGSYCAISGFDASHNRRRGYSLLSSLINNERLQSDVFISRCNNIFCTHRKPGNCCFANIAEHSCTFEKEMGCSRQPSPFSLRYLDSRGLKLGALERSWTYSPSHFHVQAEVRARLGAFKTSQYRYPGCFTIS